MNIYVGNLSYDIKEDELKELFGEFGAVESSKIISDRFSGKSKGFGFVEMSDESEGEAAINALNGSNLKGRNIRVNEFKPNAGRQGGGGGGRSSYNQRRY